MAHNRNQSLMGANVRFGSLADICGAPSHVRFAPNSDRKSGHRCAIQTLTELQLADRHDRALLDGMNPNH